MKTFTGIHIIILVAALLLLGNGMTVKAQDNIENNEVILIHGLNSASSFWNTFSSYLDDDDYEWQAPSYNSSHNGGVTGIAADIFNTYMSTGNAILVGHSAGGLIARSIMKDHPNDVLGVITMGTPNYGAGIVTSMQESSYISFIDDIVNQTETTMTTTYESFFQITWPLGTFFKPILDMLLYEAISVFNSTLETQVYPSLKEYIDENYLQLKLVEDMEPSSLFLTNLNSSLETPVYTIAGAEDPWQLYRLMGTAINGNDMSLIQETGAIREIQSFIISMINIHNCVYDGSRWLALLMPWLWFTRESVNESRRNWEDLQRLLEIDIHTQWAEQIGAYHFEERVVTIPIYDPLINSGGETPGTGSGGGGNQGAVGEVGGIIGYRQEIRTVKINDDHDGLIGTSAALLDASAFGVNTFIVQGVNHLEMNTHHDMLQYLSNAVSEINETNHFLPGITPHP